MAHNQQRENQGLGPFTRDDEPRDWSIEETPDKTWTYRQQVSRPSHERSYNSFASMTGDQFPPKAMGYSTVRPEVRHRGVVTSPYKTQQLPQYMGNTSFGVMSMTSGNQSGLNPYQEGMAQANTRFGVPFIEQPSRPNWAQDDEGGVSETERIESSQKLATVPVAKSKYKVKAPKPSVKNNVFQGYIQNLADFLKIQDRRVSDLAAVGVHSENQGSGIPDHQFLKYSERMFNAFIYLGEDLVGWSQAADRIKEGFYPSTVIETKCWDLMIKAARAQAGIQNCDKHEGRFFEEYSTWEDRMDVIVENMRVNKTYCNTIIAGDPVARIADAPATEQKMKNINKKINDKRNVQVTAGINAMAVVKANQEVDLPTLKTLLRKKIGTKHRDEGKGKVLTIEQYNIGDDDDMEGDVHSSSKTTKSYHNATKDEMTEKECKLYLCDLLQVDRSWASKFTLLELQFIARRYEKESWECCFLDTDGTEEGTFKNHRIFCPAEKEWLGHFALHPDYEHSYKKFFEDRGEIRDDEWVLSHLTHGKNLRGKQLEEALNYKEQCDLKYSVDIGRNPELKKLLGIQD